MTRLFSTISLFVLTLFAFTSANAATITVTNTNDSGAGSLRAAVLEANATTAEDTIVFDPTVFNTPRTIILTSGQIVPTHRLIINGPGSNLLSISGNSTGRIFFQDFSDSILTLTNMTLTGGLAVNGGAIYTRNELRISNSVITGNKAMGSDNQNGMPIALGGAIYASGLEITNSTLSDNQAIGAVITSTSPTFAGGAASGGGGAIFAEGPVIINCRLINNVARGADAPIVGPGMTGAQGGAAYGGAVYGSFGGIIINSTFSQNTADGGNGASLSPTASGFAKDAGIAWGGAVYSNSRFQMMNSTFNGNSSIGGNGGIAPNNPNVDGVGGHSGGGAIHNGQLEAANLTITGNTVTGGNGRVAGNGQGGGIYGGSFSWKLMSSTITGNTALAGNGTQTAGASQGGGIYVQQVEIGTASRFHNNIVADNFALAGLDVLGPFVDPFNNLVRIGDTPTAITNGVNGNQVGTFALPRDPVLGPLQNNGGFTDTRMPLAGSPVINAGDNSKTVHPITSRPTSLKPLTFDQRNFLRINPSGGVIDMGAVEWGSATVPASAVPDLQSASDTGGNNADNVTAATAPVFDIPDTIPGARVDLLRNGVVVASGTASAFNFIASLTDISPPADGTVQYTSRQTVGNVDAPISTPLNVTFDHTRPMLTINQAAGQIDPTGSIPVRFTIVASEPVSGNVLQNLSFEGSTADMSTAIFSIEGHGNNTFTIQLVNINTPGIVRLSIPENTMFDLVNNGNTASTSTDNSVTITANVVPATISGRVTRQSRRITSPTTVIVRDNFTNEIWTTRSNPFGYFRLVGIPVYQNIGRRLYISVKNKSFSTGPQMMTINGDMLNFPISVF